MRAAAAALALLVIASAGPVPAAEGLLTPNNLYRTPDRFDGRDVQVTGVLVVSTHAQVLAQSKEILAEAQANWDGPLDQFDPRRFVPFCMSLVDDGSLLKNAAKLNGRTLTLRGRFVAGYLARSVTYRSCAHPHALVLKGAEVRRLLRR